MARRPISIKVKSKDLTRIERFLRAGRETIRVLLESHDLKPWRERNVVRGGTGPELHRKNGGRTGRL